MNGRHGGPGAGRVVVGVSGSLGSLAALRAAAEEARRGGRTLLAVIAWEPPEGEYLYLRRPDPAWAAHWEQDARQRLDEAFADAFGGLPPGVEVREAAVRGRPGPALCAVAHRPDDLLVVGARTRARRARVRRYVLRHARCPLLAVPAPRAPKGGVRELRRATAQDFALRV
ncbi:MULTISPECIES: universal stress protein [unclassified Streptomyces]|uniref:Universal stress protein n=1 Tax=Streptomyces sp. NBC_00060 TaxID=2975636 RepID=A0AAU2GWP0_9ACTN